MKGSIFGEPAFKLIKVRLPQGLPPRNVIVSPSVCKFTIFEEFLMVSMLVSNKSYKYNDSYE